jgi:hypothetical protein
LIGDRHEFLLVERGIRKSGTGGAATTPWVDPAAPALSIDWPTRQAALTDRRRS